MEEHAACHTHWFYTAVDALSVHLLHTSAVHVHQPEAGREEPDVVERGIGKLASPLRGDEDATQCCGDHVAEFLPEGETCVREFPDTVNAVSTLGLRQDIFELTLK